ELVEPGLADLPAAVGGHVDSMRVAGRGPVQPHLEANRPSVRRRREDEVQVAAVEPEEEPPTRGLGDGALGTDVPRSDQRPLAHGPPLRCLVGAGDIPGQPPMCGESLALPVPDVRLGRPYRVAGRGFDAHARDLYRALVQAGRSVLLEQLLQDALGL